MAKHVALIHKLQIYINWYATVSDAICTLVCTVSNLLIYNNCTWFVRKLCNFFHLTECWLSSSEVSGLVASVMSSPRLKTYTGEEQHTASGKYIIECGISLMLVDLSGSDVFHSPWLICEVACSDEALAEQLTCVEVVCTQRGMSEARTWALSKGRGLYLWIWRSIITPFNYLWRLSRGFHFF